MKERKNDKNYVVVKPLDKMDTAFNTLNMAQNNASELPMQRIPGGSGKPNPQVTEARRAPRPGRGNSTKASRH